RGRVCSGRPVHLGRRKRIPAALQVRGIPGRHLHRRAPLPSLRQATTFEQAEVLPPVPQLDVHRASLLPPHASGMAATVLPGLSQPPDARKPPVALAVIPALPVAWCAARTPG